MEREKMSRVIKEFKKVLEGALWGREFNVRKRKSKALFFRKFIYWTGYIMIEKLKKCGGKKIYNPCVMMILVKKKCT